MGTVCPKRIATGAACQRRIANRHSIPEKGPSGHSKKKPLQWHTQRLLVPHSRMGKVKNLFWGDHKYVHYVE